MAKCPNCGVQIRSDASQCAQCSALFTEADGWRPIQDGSPDPADAPRPQNPASRQADKENPPTRDVTSLEPSATRTALFLAKAAAVLWFASLFLPAFVVESRTEAIFGATVLLMGLLFGWAVNGTAAYANLLLPYVLIRLHQGKPASVAVSLMLLLGLSVFFFVGVPRDEGTGIVLPVVSWGWGAILWGSSLLLAGAASGIYLRWYGRTGALRIVACLGIMLASVGVIHLIHSHTANTQEREIYLSRGMAFTVSQFCGIDFVWPESPLVAPGETVALDIDESLKGTRSGSPYLLLPKLVNVQDDGYHWRTYHYGHTSIQVRRRASESRYVLQARRASDFKSAVIRILDRANGQTLYEQPLRSVPVPRLRSSSYSQYCPFATQHWSGLTRGYDTAVLRALDQQPLQRQMDETLHPEEARLTCNLGEVDIDGVKGLREWDGRQVILNQGLASRAGFCSTHYIGLVHLSTAGEDAQDDLRPVVHLFERKTLKPIAVFNDRRPCPLRKRCDVIPNSITKGFRVESSGKVTVDTTHGTVTATRIVVN